VRLERGEGGLVLAREGEDLRLHRATEGLEPLLRLVALRARRRHQPLPVRARAVLRLGTAQHRAQRAHPGGELRELRGRRRLAPRLELEPVLQLAHLARERSALGVRGAQRVRLRPARQLELLLRLLARHPRLRRRRERLVPLPLHLAQHALLLALQPLEELLVAACRLPLPLLLLPRRLQLLLERLDRAAHHALVTLDVPRHLRHGARVCPRLLPDRTLVASRLVQLCREQAQHRQRLLEISWLTHAGRQAGRRGGSSVARDRGSGRRVATPLYRCERAAAG